MNKIREKIIEEQAIITKLRDRPCDTYERYVFVEDLITIHTGRVIAFKQALNLVDRSN